MFTKQFLMLLSLLLSTPVFANQIDDQLEREISEINRTLPKMMEATLVEAADYNRKKRVLTYLFRLFVDPKISKEKKDAQMASLKKQALRTNCTDPDIRKVLDDGVVLAFGYYTAHNDEHLFDIILLKEDCPK